MKKLGIIGGLGPESTIIYYKKIISAFSDSFSTSGNPEIIIDSVDLNNFLQLAENGNWDIIINQLSESAERLYNAGANFGVLASNTPHKVFSEIQNKTKLPLIDLIEETAIQSKSLDIKAVGLLGTGFTMKSDFYKKAFETKGIKLFTPNIENIEYIHNKIFTELEFGVVKDENKSRFIQIINNLINEHNIEGIIMGCTELPLIIQPNDIDIHYIDTTDVHVNTILKRLKT